MRLVIIGLVSMSTAASAASVTSIPATHRVILSGVWTPTTAQTQQALESIESFLARPTSGDRWDRASIASIRGEKHALAVQFVGKRRKGRLVIHCNFFPAPKGAWQNDFPYWKRQEVLVSDGGASFWRIDYDVVTHTCEEFSANGVG